ncbi:hypothetical protein [Streptomyces anulatus]|uniref:Mce-associated membrane protein n=1 Tax=Streptomyces anulatus TaxID=1892 RepID=A0ABZ1ZDU5_STRAQ|nr:hypothetical protein [Streptomyces anulatus]WSU32974.1 hypothetical protein OG391_33260 [Streptomyces anulatus]
MSTTRHLVNRRRRLATAPPRTPGAEPDPASETTATATATDTGTATATDTGTATTTATVTDAAEPQLAEDTATDPDAETDATAGPDTAPDAPGNAPRDKASRLRVGIPAVLCALTVLLGAFAVWAFASVGDLRDEPARQNTALTDIGRTSEVKGRISEAVGAVFSYDYASPARSDRAASTYLTGRAVQQHKDMLADVREQAPRQKLVLTTTVTESGVEFLDGDRARLLIFADQSNTRTGKDEETTYAAAMFAVDAVRRGDTWLIAAIDTFTR